MASKTKSPLWGIVVNVRDNHGIIETQEILGMPVESEASARNHAISMAMNKAKELGLNYFRATCASVYKLGQPKDAPRSNSKAVVPAPPRPAVPPAPSMYVIPTRCPIVSLCKTRFTGSEEDGDIFISIAEE